MVYKTLICIFAGMGAGITTGFAGLSAAVFITPMLVSFLDVPVFDAVGIALASDVLASAISAYTYGKNGNIDLKRGKRLMISVLSFAIIGSGIAFFLSASETGDTILGFWSILGSIYLGFNFLLHPEGSSISFFSKLHGRSQALTEIACGAFVGFVCGFQGTGGGLLMLLILTIVMQFEYKKAVGTSVFIMTFTALIGSISHFLMNGFPSYDIFCICVASTLIFARIGAVIANRISARSLHLITGTLLSVMGVVMLINKLI